MKATPRILSLLQFVACLLVAMAAMSCQTNTKPSTAAARKPVTHNIWVKVSSQPPTYYPRGVAADCDTDHWSGEWVDTWDESGTRYFIPFRGLGGIDRQTLVTEALSRRSERKLAVIESEDREILARNVRNMALFGPPTYTLLLAAAMGGGSPDNVDIHRLQKEWHSSKEPHG